VAVVLIAMMVVVVGGREWWLLVVSCRDGGGKFACTTVSLAVSGRVGGGVEGGGINHWSKTNEKKSTWARDADASRAPFLLLIHR
jgi:hypothetical protein